MKFLVDAQVPRKLAKTINDAGYRAIHTLLLPDANKTTDAYINQLSVAEEWIVITKDSGFVDSFLLKNEPWKLLLI
jgi:predicted nuclease of predicted toxin-antitoxin system